MVKLREHETLLAALTMEYHIELSYGTKWTWAHGFGDTSLACEFLREVRKLGYGIHHGTYPQRDGTVDVRFRKG